jgi:beta-N-acetylhexosaminidase
MDMKAVAAHWGRGPAAVMALRAGVDVVMACGPAEAQWATIEAIRSAAEDGTLEAAALRGSTARLLEAKARHAGPGRPPLAFEKPDHEAAAQAIADRAVTLVRDDAGRIPLRGGRTVVLHVGTDSWVQDAPRLGEELAALMPGVSIASAASGVTERSWDAVVVVSLSWRSAQGVDTIVELHREFGQRLIVVGAGNPYELLRFPTVPAYLAAYGPDPPSMRAATKVLAGTLEPHGRLPVSLPPLYPRGHSA